MTDSDSYISIKNWAEADRPREKMMRSGEAALTDAELLAILIGSGSSRKSAVALMQEILSACDGRLSALSRMSIEELMRWNGIGEAKAITLKAAAEIGRRRALEKAQDYDTITNAADVYRLMHPRMQDLRHEEFWVILLNNQSKVLKTVRMSSGGITQTAVDVRMILREALLSGATRLVACHNHPGGSTRPSTDDRNLTLRIKAAAGQVDIRLIDHVIITDGNYYSFADNGTI